MSGDRSVGRKVGRQGSTPSAGSLHYRHLRGHMLQPMDAGVGKGGPMRDFRRPRRFLSFSAQACTTALVVWVPPAPCPAMAAVLKKHLDIANAAWSSGRLSKTNERLFRQRLRRLSEEPPCPWMRDAQRPGAGGSILAVISPTNSCAKGITGRMVYCESGPSTSFSQNCLGKNANTRRPALRWNSTSAGKS